MHTLCGILLITAVVSVVSSPVVPEQEKLSVKDLKNYSSRNPLQTSKFARETDDLKRKAKCFWFWGDYGYLGPPGPMGIEMGMGPMGMGPMGMDMGPMGMDMGPMGMDMGPMGMGMGPGPGGMGMGPYIFGENGYYRREDSAIKDPVLKTKPVVKLRK